jgi:hypothetical protein
MGPEFPLSDSQETAMTTKTNKRVLLEAGIYQRGDVYDVRVAGWDTAGKRKFYSRTVRGRIREARRVRDQLRAMAATGSVPPPRGGRGLTVGVFLQEHFLPWLEVERVQKAGTLHPNTYIKYEGYVRSKVVPRIGDIGVTELNTGDVERMLNDLRVGGRDPSAGVGRPRSRPEWVYEQVAQRAAEGWSYSDISLYLSSKWPEECAGMSKNAVAAIRHRARTTSSA